MASSRQIEHLERKHKENPGGLTFAPLANAYRNSGQPERAIEILIEGLEHHPEHAPARIVLGRCHLDLEDDSAAEPAFAGVFDLDKENVVALKALADICERASRFEDAARWLGHLLEADRNNREAREQLERVSYTKEIATETAEGAEASLDVSSHEAAQEPQEIDHDEGAEPPMADEAAAASGVAFGGAEPFVFGTPWGEADLAAEETVGEEAPEELTIDKEVSEAAEPSIEQPYGSWEPPGIASEVTEGQSASGLDGPGGPSEDAAAAETSDWLPAEPVEDLVVEEDLVEKGLEATLDSEDEATLSPDAANEFQTPDTPEGLSLHARAENELQVERAGEGLELSASEENEFQQSSDAEALRPSVEEDAGEQVISLGGSETSPFQEAADPGSWFSPAPDEEAASVAPESGPDGTPEPLETAFGSEPDAPVEPPLEESEPLPSPWGPAGDVAPESTQEPLETAFDSEPDTAVEPTFEESEALPSPWGPAGEVERDGTPEVAETAFGSELDTPDKPLFEESEPLPSPWGPAGDVEEEIRAESDESPLAGSESTRQHEEVTEFDVTSDEESEIEVEPGSLLADEAAEDAELSEDDVYPEVLGSDQDQVPPVQVEPAAGAEPETAPAFVATETMAEVYLSQGHRLEALDVYRVLLQSTPGDARLSEKVSALEEELEGGVVAREDAAPEVDGFPGESGGRYAASATGGRTVKALFQDLLATKPVAETSLEAPPTQEAGDLVDTGQNVVGEPTRPAQDPLSLSAIFGEDTSPVPPALGRGSAKAEEEEGFSFDNFFGDEKDAASSERPSGGPPKGREAEDDLDQFQSWLQGLKG